MLGPFLEGLYRRFEEGHEDASTDLRKMFPDWTLGPRINHQTEAARAAEAASGVAAAIGVTALLRYRGKLPDEDTQSKAELAVAVAYAQLIYAYIGLYLKGEGIDIEMTSTGSIILREIIYLSVEFRSRCLETGLKIAADLLQNQAENVKEWRESLRKLVGAYLLSGARRNLDFEEDIQSAIVSHSRGLYGAFGMEHKKHSAHGRYEALASAWQAAGKPDAVLLHGHSLAVLRCWLTSEGAQSEKVSELLREFEQTSGRAQPAGWYDAILRTREHCSVCGESYRIENLKLCTGCSHTYCYQCLGDLARAANGNLACSCGGELVG